MSVLSKLKGASRQELWGLCKQFIKFGLVGVSNTAISLGIYYLFLWINDAWYIVGHMLGFIVSVLNAYYWNHKYVFDRRGPGHTRRLVKTFVSYGLTFLLSTGLVFAMVEWLGIPKAIPPIISLLVTIPLNFLLNKFWTVR